MSLDQVAMSKFYAYVHNGLAHLSHVIALAQETRLGLCGVMLRD